MDEPKPRRRRRPPQTQILVEETEKTSTKHKEVSNEIVQLQTQRSGKHRSNVSTIFIFSATILLLIFLVALCLHLPYDNFPMFESEEEMLNRIQGIYKDTDQIVNGGIQIDGNTIRHIDIFGIVELHILELDPVYGLITAVSFSRKNTLGMDLGEKVEFRINKSAECIDLIDNNGRITISSVKAVDWTPGPVRTPTPSPRPPETMASALRIRNQNTYRRGDYLYITGSIYNSGRRTYEYVKVRAELCDANGKVLDTDWTYAVDGDGIRPNEEKRYEIMMKYSGERYRVYIVD